jgi:hypothetical protein
MVNNRNEPPLTTYHSLSNDFVFANAVQEFCDEHYSGNYLIRPPKVAHYLKDRIFNASTKARVKGHNHDGAIGRTKADPAVDPEAAKAEAAKIRSRFNTGKESERN